MIGERFDAVLEAARGGEEWAFGVLYRDLAPTVLGYLRGRGALEPEDLAAEVFVGVAKGLRKFRGDEAAFRSWVFAIAHRRLVDERRRRGRRPEDAAGLAPPVDDAGLAPTAEDEALARAGMERLRAVLEELTEDQRDVVLLRLVADLPVAEVARVLRKRPGAVKTLQRRALARLARLVPEPDQPPPDGPEEADETCESRPQHLADEGEPFPDRPVERSPRR